MAPAANCLYDIAVKRRLADVVNVQPVFARLNGAGVDDAAGERAVVGNIVDRDGGSSRGRYGAAVGDVAGEARDAHSVDIEAGFLRRNRATVGDVAGKGRRAAGGHTGDGDTAAVRRRDRPAVADVAMEITVFSSLFEKNSVSGRRRDPAAVAHAARKLRKAHLENMQAGCGRDHTAVIDGSAEGSSAGKIHHGEGDTVGARCDHATVVDITRERKCHKDTVIARIDYAGVTDAAGESGYAEQYDAVGIVGIGFYNPGVLDPPRKGRNFEDENACATSISAASTNDRTGVADATRKARFILNPNAD